MNTLDAWLVVLQEVKNGRANDAAYGYLWSGNLARLKQDLERAEKLRNISTARKHGRTRQERQGKLSRILGRHFELTLKRLFDGCSALAYHSNVRTTVSEIDCLFTITPSAGLVPFLSQAGTHVIGEAKFYKDAFKTEWVNELVGILNAHGAKIAFLFVGCSQRKVNSGFRNLLGLQAASGNYFIVPVGQKQFQEVLAGENLLKVLNQQFVMMRSMATELSV